jgi:recombination protein RecA
MTKDKDTVSKFKAIGLLSEQNHNLGFVSTGSYALNKIISGDYSKGIPIGMITQFLGESSTAKTVFLTHILREAQKVGYHTILIDSENTYNSDFARTLGIDPGKLLYSAPDTLEDCFQAIHETILAIRETDPTTPIVVGYDSLAVSPTRAEIESDDYTNNNMEGAIRAKITGSCLRSINPLLRKHKVALVIINQIRNKVGVMYGSPDTPAAGGKSLEYYIGVNLKCISNKTSDLLLNDEKEVIGIQGRVKNVKNKISIPFKECEFELLFDTGLNNLAGLVKYLEAEAIIARAGAWYSVVKTGLKFQAKDFANLVRDLGNEGMEPVQTILGLR